MRRLVKISFLYSLLNINILYVLGINLLVDTKLGQIRGLSADDGDYSMFLGIPYARVRQDNPFADAIPQGPFDDVFEANNDTAICPQINPQTKTLAGTLDCLHLNVYVPSSANSLKHLPVLVWIHGGTWVDGDYGRHTWGPKYLVRHNVILVTVNYRLGPYGFMCIHTPKTPGNQGLKDQYLALKWVKDNIEAFGGHSKQITLSASSSGSVCLDFHIHSPREKVFNKAIMQSGTNQFLFEHAPVLDAPLKLAKYFGHETEDIDTAVSFLANLDSNFVITAVNALNLHFTPCIEKAYGNIDRFITQNWITADIPNVYNMSVLIGINSQEELVQDKLYNNIIRDKLEIEFNIDDVVFDGMEDIVKRYYIGDEPITKKVTEEMVTFQSDFKFNHSILRIIRKYIEHGAGNIYFYVFSYVGGRNYLRLQHTKTALKGAAHADEVGYLFDVPFLPKPTTKDQLVIDRMTTMWTNFVKYSDPTPELSDLLTTKWTPISNGSRYHYLDIDDELTAGTRPFSSRMAFWDLFYKANRDLRKYPGQKPRQNVSHNYSNRLLAAKLVLLFFLLITF